MPSISSLVSLPTRLSRAGTTRSRVGSDSLSLREFLRLESRVPDHSWLSRTRTAEDLVRQRIGAGTPREAVARGYGGIFVPLTPTGAKAVALAVSESGQTAFAAAFLIRPRFLLWE